MAISSYLELYMVSLENYPFARQPFYLNSSLLQMIIMLHPSRVWHNGDTGVDLQQGPAPRILFRLRPYVNLFYCLLLIHIPRFPTIAEEEAGVLASAAPEVPARTWTLGA